MIYMDLTSKYNNKTVLCKNTYKIFTPFTLIQYLKPLYVNEFENINYFEDVGVLINSCGIYNCA